MDNVAIKPIRSNAFYQGFYSELAFNVLGNPVPLYRNLLKHLGQFGANLSALTTNLATLTEASVTCYLEELSIFLAFRLDRFDLTAGKLYELSPDMATEILARGWATVHDTDESLHIARHVVTATVYTQILSANYDQVVGRFIRPPEGLGAGSQAGAIFFISDTRSEGSIALDRVPGQKQQLIVRLSVGFDGKQLAVEGVVHESSEYLDKHLKTLGIILEQ